MFRIRKRKYVHIDFTKIFTFLFVLSGLNVNYSILWGENCVLGHITVGILTLVRIGVCIYSVYILLNSKLNLINIKFMMYFMGVFLLNILAEFNGTGGGMRACIHRSFSIIYLFLYYTCIIYITKKNQEDFLKIIFCISIFLFMDSLILYCFQPEIATYYEGNGIYTLSGVSNNRNQVIEYWILGTMGLFGLDKLRDNKVCFLLWGGTIFIQTLTKSGTGIIVMIITISMLLIYKFYKRYFKLVLEISYIVLLLVYIIMVFNQRTLFENIIVRLLHKSPTLTGRFLIWKLNIKYIEESLLIGYGYDGKYGISVIDNSIIYLLVVSGVLGLLIWLFMLVSSHLAVLTKKELTTSEAVYCIGIFTYLVRGITESVLSYPHIVFWSLFILLEMSKYRADNAARKVMDNYLKI